MTTIESSPAALTARAFAEAYGLVRRIELKIAAAYDGASFELLCGPDGVLHLRAYTPEGALTDLLDLVEADLIALEDEHDLTLYVVPLRVEDREDYPPSNMREPVA